MRTAAGVMKSIALCCLVVLISARAAAGVCASTAECLAVIDRVQQDTRTISAHFAQVKHVSLLEEPITSSGHLLLKRPDHILIRIDNPQPATVRINKGQVEIPNLPEHERQALSMAPMAGMFGNIDALFSGSLKGMQEKFDIAATGDSGGIDVRLIPRDESLKQSFHTIELRFDGPQVLIHRIRIEDALGDHLELTLQNVQRNVDIPDAVFTAKDTPRE